MKNFIFWSPDHAGQCLNADCETLPLLLMAESIAGCSCSTVAGDISQETVDLCVNVAGETSSSNDLTYADGAQRVDVFLVRDADYDRTENGFSNAVTDGAARALFRVKRRIDDPEIYAAMVGARVAADSFGVSGVFFALVTGQNKIYIV